MRRVLAALTLTTATVLAVAEEGTPRPWLHLRTHGLAKVPVEVIVEVQAAEGDGAGERLVLRAPGSVELPLPGSGPWTVRALAPGTWSTPLAIDSPPAAALTLDLWPETRLLARLQVGQGDTRPTAVSLRLQNAGTGAPRELGEATVLCPLDSEGRLDCRLPRLAGLDLRLRAPGFASRFFWDVDLSGGDSHDLGLVPLRAGASVVGRVAVPGGYALGEVVARLEPVAGAPGAPDGRVARQAEVTARPDERGFFALEGLPAGSYRLRVVHPDLAPYELSPVGVIAGGQSEVAERIELVEPVAFRLLLDPLFDPYGRDWRVQLYHRSGGETGSRVENGDLEAAAGYVEAGVAPGSYEVRVLDSQAVRVATEEVVLAAGDGPHPLEIRPILVEGLVTLGDEPLLAGVTFRGPATYEMHSDVEGRFSGYLPQAGDWDVAVEAIEPPVRRRSRSIPVVPEEGGGPATVHLRLPDTAVRGAVVDDRGSPVADAVVTVTDPLHSTREVSASTDREGRFEIWGLDEGVVQAQAEHRPAQGEGASSEPARVELRDGVPPSDLRLVLRPHARLFGRVVAADGNPVPNAWLEAHPFSASGVLDALFAQPRQTDVGGRFELSLPQGIAVVHLVALAPGHPLTQRALGLGDAGDVVLGATGGSLVVALPRRVGDIPWNDPSQPRPGLVRGPSKLPLALLSRWAAANGTQWQPDDQQVVVPMLEPGGYRVCWFGTADWLLLAAAGGDCVTAEVPGGGTAHTALPEPDESGAADPAPPR